MRIYVSVDLEGIYGVDRYDSHEKTNYSYQLWKQYVGQLMFEEVLAVYEALVYKGATEVIVFDSHSGDDTTLLLPQDFPKLTLVKRTKNSREQFPSFDSSVNSIILWGYHAKAGNKNGKLEHTNSRRVRYVKINGNEVGEVYLHGLYAYHKGIPLIAISGDGGLKNEVVKDVGSIPFFISDLGKTLSRIEYLNSIKEFIFNLDYKEILNINRAFKWPVITTMEVSYKSALVNIFRWILRKQFRHGRLKYPFSCIYDQGSFVQQWNRYNGFQI